MPCCAFALPTALAAHGYALRPETDSDIGFVSALYASTREAEIARMLHWTASQKQAFLAQQFAAQRHHYRTRIMACDFWLIERDGDPIGRLYLEDRATRWHVVDIALQPRWRGRGVGGAVLRAVIAAARDNAKCVSLFVDRNNGARRLYRRLGFTEIGATAFHIEMECGTDRLGLS